MASIASSSLDTIPVSVYITYENNSTSNCSHLCTFKLTSQSENPLIRNESKDGDTNEWPLYLGYEMKPVSASNKSIIFAPEKGIRRKTYATPFCLKIPRQQIVNKTLGKLLKVNCMFEEHMDGLGQHTHPINENFKQRDDIESNSGYEYHVRLTKMTQNGNNDQVTILHELWVPFSK